MKTLPIFVEGVAVAKLLELPKEDQEMLAGMDNLVVFRMGTTTVWVKCGFRQTAHQRKQTHTSSKVAQDNGEYNL